MTTAAMPCADEDLIELARRARGGDTTARNVLVARHYGLAKTIARRYRNRGLDSADLSQEAISGLMSAAERYDPEAYSSGFAAFASPWIRGAILQAIRKAGLIRIPEHRHRIGDRPPRWCQDVAGEDSDHANMIESMPSPRAEPPSARLERRESSSLLCRAIQQLPPREMALIVYHFGLDGGPARSQEELASQFRLGHKSVAIAIDAGLDRLRNNPNLEGRLAWLSATYPARCDPRRPRS